MDLQKGPLGILGWFALKVTGRNPPSFGDAVVPMVEVGDQYLATSELQVKNAVLATSLAAFNQQTISVPAGKVWRLIAASFNGALNAADAALISQMAIAVIAPGGASNCSLVTGPAYASTSIRQVAVLCRPPVFLPSGWSLNFNMFTSAAITVTSNIQCNAFVQEFDL
jgi:hypothetical protein